MSRLLDQGCWIRTAASTRGVWPGRSGARLGVTWPTWAMAMLVIDETRDLKKGDRSVGTRRQYTGTAGRIENAQVRVFLTYATAAGHMLIDREIYLPHSWIDDPDRCAAAGIPADTTFATKAALATRLIVDALLAGVPASRAGVTRIPHRPRVHINAALTLVG